VTTAVDWSETFTKNPQVLWGLVADVVKAVKAGEGERRTGRRPAASVGSIDELYEVLFPACYSTAPFPEALAVALGAMSQRAFADQVGFNQATVSRLISGKTAPTVEMIERISHTLNVRPTHFVEYRALKLGQVITDVLLANPTLSAESVRRLAGAPA
jgi:plasmid maintenance system antidote protein VapI